MIGCKNWPDIRFFNISDRNCGPSLMMTKISLLQVEETKPETKKERKEKKKARKQDQVRIIVDNLRLIEYFFIVPT